MASRKSCAMTLAFEFAGAFEFLGVYLLSWFSAIVYRNSIV